MSMVRMPMVVVFQLRMVISLSVFCGGREGPKLV
jgi:hypothetical protein